MNRDYTHDRTEAFPHAWSRRDQTSLCSLHRKGCGIPFYMEPERNYNITVQDDVIKLGLRYIKQFTFPFTLRIHMNN